MLRGIQVSKPATIDMPTVFADILIQAHEDHKHECMECRRKGDDSTNVIIIPKNDTTHYKHCRTCGNVTQARSVEIFRGNSFL